jgi:hypothetical protein
VLVVPAVASAHSDAHTLKFISKSLLENRSAVGATDLDLPGQDAGVSLR